MSKLINFPSAKDENFRYVSLRDFEWNKLAPKEVLKPSSDWNKFDSDQGARYLLGPLSELPLSHSNNQFDSHVNLSLVDRELPDCFREDVFASLLNTKKALLLSVKKGFSSEKTLRLSQILSATKATFIQRVLLDVEDNVNLTILHDLRMAEGATQGAFVEFLEGNIGANSRVKLFVEQALKGCEAFALRHCWNVGRDSKLSYWAYHSGANRGQHRVECFAREEGVESELNFGVRAKGKQGIDLWVQNHHNVKNTRSDTNAWNVVEDEATVVFNGNINIGPKGLFTQAYQNNKNLLLSEKGQVHTLPKLEIATDDVKCSHGATVASLDSDQLFYLRSRGIAQEAAERMLIDAFKFPVLSQIPLMELRQKYLGEMGEEI